MPDERSLNAPAPQPEAVEGVLDRLRVGLVADGGNLELQGVDTDGTVRVSFQGECADCPAQLATLRVAIERPLIEAIEGVTAVVAV